MYAHEGQIERTRAATLVLSSFQRDLSRACSTAFLTRLRQANSAFSTATLMTISRTHFINHRRFTEGTPFHATDWRRSKVPLYMYRYKKSIFLTKNRIFCGNQYCWSVKRLYSLGYLCLKRDKSCRSCPFYYCFNNYELKRNFTKNDMSFIIIVDLLENHHNHDIAYIPVKQCANFNIIDQEYMLMYI